MLKLRKNKKGFTLVEVIVVLVIIALLAAIMIPGMTKWIDKAKGKSILIEARSALLAAQTLASEEYAKATPVYNNVNDTNCKALAAYPGTIAVTVNNLGQVSILKYTATDGKSITYTLPTGTGAGGWGEVV